MLNSHNPDQTEKHHHKNSITELEDHSKSLQEWLLHTPIGREILHKERLFFAQNVGQIFGNYSLQIGLSNINLLHGNKIQNHYTINTDLHSDLRFLPIATDSINLIVCPHVLEFTNNYHHVLQELYRILAPNGKIILTCFNRKSWFGLFKHKIPLFKNKNTQLISLSRIKDQVQALNFAIDRGKFFSYCPPFSKAHRLRRYQWLNKVGDRWFPTWANSFAFILSKEIITPNLIRSKDLEVFNKIKPQLGTANLYPKYFDYEL